MQPLFEPENERTLPYRISLGGRMVLFELREWELRENEQPCKKQQLRIKIAPLGYTKRDIKIQPKNSYESKIRFLKKAIICEKFEFRSESFETFDHSYRNSVGRTKNSKFPLPRQFVVEIFSFWNPRVSVSPREKGTKGWHFIFIGKIS